MNREKLETEAKAPDWLDRLVEEIRAKAAQGEHPSLAFLMESLLNELMTRERDRHLEDHPGEQANGLCERNLHLTLGKLRLRVPRVRSGKAFRPAILPPRWKRAHKDYEELLIAMLANGYSQAQMERTLKSLNLPFSPDALEDAKALIRGQLQFYKSQPLSSDWFAIFIDGYWGKLRTEDGKVHDVVLFVAVGIDLEGTKHILGFWVLQGRERGAFWVQVLQDLVNRGVHRVLLFVTDDFRGLSEVIRKLFPYAEHQLCHLHLERNLKRKLSQDCYKQARRLLLRIRQARDREEGTVPFAALCQLVEQEKPQLAKHLQDCEENYLAFLGYPDEVRRHIYTTNVVEGLNAGIDRMRLDLGGYFPSQDCLEVNLFVQAVNLQDMWWRKPLPQVRAASYKLHQLFTLQYELDEEGAMLHNF